MTLTLFATGASYQQALQRLDARAQEALQERHLDPTTYLAYRHRPTVTQRGNTWTATQKMDVHRRMQGQPTALAATSALITTAQF